MKGYRRCSEQRTFAAPVDRRLPPLLRTTDLRSAGGSKATAAAQNNGPSQRRWIEGYRRCSEQRTFAAPVDRRLPPLLRTTDLRSAGGSKATAAAQNNGPSQRRWIEGYRR